MPRVHFVKKAQKDYRGDNIKRGESYYWWKFNYGHKQRSKTHPKPQQLTRSDFWIQVYDFQDELNDVQEQDSLQDIADRIREFADEQEEKKNNMPESLQEGPIGELLTSRQDSLNEWADELEQMDADEEFEYDDLPSYNGE